GYLPGRVTVGSAGGGRGGPATVSGITLASGDRGTGYDFGELAPASLSGIVYADANDNGSKQPGEAPIPGVRVTLNGTTDLGLAVALTATTAADGSYHFPHLRPGSYAVTV